MNAPSMTHKKGIIVITICNFHLNHFSITLILFNSNKQKTSGVCLHVASAF